MLPDRGKGQGDGDRDGEEGGSEPPRVYGVAFGKAPTLGRCSQRELCLCLRGKEKVPFPGGGHRLTCPAELRGSQGELGAGLTKQAVAGRGPGGGGEGWEGGSFGCSGRVLWLALKGPTWQNLNFLPRVGGRGRDTHLGEEGTPGGEHTRPRPNTTAPRCGC